MIKYISGGILLAIMLCGCATAPEAEDENTYTAPPSSHAKLAGSSWYLGGDETGNSPTLQFSKDSKITGSGGCNSYFADYTQPDGMSGGSHLIEITQLGSTEMACESDIMGVEQSFFDNLASATSFNIVHGNALLLYGEDGAKILRLRKSED